MSGFSANLTRNCFARFLNFNYPRAVTVSPLCLQQTNRSYSNEVTVTAAPIPMKKEKISKAMKAYLERAREHDEFMKTENLEYQIGKRHLANMMGENPETFTQEDVDRAIEYLFPSGLFDRKARPTMKPPEEIFPARKAAEFDETGRPYHSMFYTGKANFFQLLYDIVEEINGLNDFEERMLRKDNQPDPNLKLELSGSEWLPKEQLELELVEKIADIEYQNFVNSMERLLSLPYSYKCKEFIVKYRKPLLSQTTAYDIPKPQFDENGKQYVTIYECLRKRARGDVTIRSPGTGNISINGQDITYFEEAQPREQNIIIQIEFDLVQLPGLIMLIDEPTIHLYTERKKLEPLSNFLVKLYHSDDDICTQRKHWSYE